jgi:hypothetical protein
MGTKLVKIYFWIFTLLSLSFCISAQQKFANDIGCKLEDTKLTTQVKAPAYSAQSGTCKEVPYTCRQAPFYYSCKPDSEWSKSK